MTISRDIAVAIFLLAVCSVLWFASYEIRVPDYGQLSPATWPRLIIGALTLLSVIYLVQSVRVAGKRPAASTTESSAIHATDNALDNAPDNAVNSVSTKSAAAYKAEPLQSPAEEPKASFYSYWRNVIWCFMLFGLYLYTLPWLGMLVGALAFVFLLLCALGGWQPRKLVLHAAIAVLTVGGMWSLFTYGLDVLLPTGTLFDKA